MADGLLGSMPLDDRTLGLLFSGLATLGNNYGPTRGAAFQNAINGGLGMGLGFMTKSIDNQRAQQKLGMDREQLDLMKSYRDLQGQQMSAQTDELRRKAELERALLAARQAISGRIGQPTSLAPTQANADAIAGGTAPTFSVMDAVNELVKRGDYAGAESLQKTIPKNTGSPVQVLGKDGAPTLYQGSEYGSPRPLGLTPYVESRDPVVQNYRHQNAAAGAPQTRVDVKTGENFWGGLAKGLAEDFTGQRGQARSAVGAIQNLHQIRQALDSGDVIAGPGATTQLLGTQVAQRLGIADQDATQRLVKTRQAIQGLARASLAGAKQLQGQGQITEFERKLIDRAESGDIDSMTVPELRTLVDALERSHQTTITGYNKQVEQVRSDPRSGPIQMFLSPVDVPVYVPSGNKPSAAPASNIGAGTRKVINGKGYVKRDDGKWYPE